MIYVIAIVAMLIGMGLILVRALRGPTAYDRILSANIFGTATVLTIALFSELKSDPMLLDMALLYGLINFVATIALLRYFKFGGFDDRD
ncbi:MAG: monovalent cation/H+ antiporter complex subunit F [Alphaproteobacteria bacterium]|nr:monovalent cation/H+ antiporter complex subunit F [Alphaproteobacteria bacterium]